jgi:hypothetical protein
MVACILEREKRGRKSDGAKEEDHEIETGLPTFVSICFSFAGITGLALARCLLLLLTRVWNIISYVCQPVARLVFGAVSLCRGLGWAEAGWLAFFRYMERGKRRWDGVEIECV